MRVFKEFRRFGQEAKGAISGDKIGELQSPSLSTTVIIATIFINILSLAMPLVILQVYDRIISNAAFPTFSLMMMGLMTAVLLEFCMRIARARIVGFSAAQFEHQLAINAMQHVLNAPAKAVEKETPSHFFYKLSSIDSLRSFYGGQSRLVFLDLPFVFMFLWLIWFVAGPIVFIPIGLFTLLAAITMYHGMRLRGLMERRNQYDQTRYDYIVEALKNIAGIKANANESLIQKRYEKLMSQGTTMNYDSIVLSNEAQSLVAVFSNFAMVTVVTSGAYMVINGNLSVGALAAVTLLSGRAIQPLMRGLSAWSQVQSLDIARTHLSELLTIEQKKYPAPELQPPASAFRGKIEFKNVSLKSHNSDNLILENLNLTIRSGEFIGIRGKNTDGRQDILKVLTGETTPDSGLVTVDNYRCDGIMRESIRDQIGYVAPNAVMFEGTLIDNITMFKRGDIVDDALKASRLIGLEREVNKLPLGYDTLMSPSSNEGIPLGIAQQVMIARALTRRPKIMILHDSTSWLDSASEKAIREALQRLTGRMTIILMTWRPSLLKLAQNSYELGDGHLILMNPETMFQQGSKNVDQAPVGEIQTGTL